MRQTVTFEVKINEYGELMCPCCGDSSYLHQFHVTVEENARAKETNQNIFLRTDASLAGASSTMDTIGCAGSYGRSATKIYFYCEWCPCISQIELNQYKGVTQLYWGATYEDETALPPEVRRSLDLRRHDPEQPKASGIIPG